MSAAEQLDGQRVPDVSWDTFMDYWRKTWRQGEHVSYIGPTGSGKTTLAVELLGVRRHVVALATKPRDSTMDRLIRDGYRKIKTWPPPRVGGSRVVLWPPFRDDSDLPNQQAVMASALRGAFTEQSWTIFADELWYLGTELRLDHLLRIIWTQGRSLDVTLVGGTQRPAHVPLLAYDQATHLFFFRDNDETNLRRISGLGGLNSALIRRTVAALPRHVALYVNTRTGQLVTTRAPKPKG